MSIINSQPLIGASGNQVTGYNLDRSLRFRSSASAYLNRSPASSSNRKTWTFSTWVKRGTLSSDMLLLSVGSSDSARTLVYLDSANTMRFLNNYAGAGYVGTATNAVLRDPAAWYHLVYAIDTTQATAANRIKLYINGVQQTTTTVTIPQNEDTYINTGGTHYIGRSAAGQSSTDYFDGYLAETNFIDGQALTPSDFGETDTATGVWKPKKYTGTYGTNGFYLDFEDTTSTTTLGYDAAGSNDWTVNNISLTSGATYDSMKDVPTLTSATAANYCVFSPIASRMNVGSITDGGLTISTYSGNSQKRASFGVTTGKWYWEITNTGGASPTNAMIGICESSKAVDASAFTDSGLISYYANGDKYVNGTGSAYGASYTTNDVIGVALDIDGGTVTFYKNNSSQGAITLASITTYVPFLANGSGSSDTTYAANFGQRPFAYTPPSGFVALNTYNLPTPTIGATASSQANKYMDATTYTGTGSSASIVNAGEFKPDLVWIKSRSNAYIHTLEDTVRGVSKYLDSASTAAEVNDPTYFVTAFNSNGFTQAGNSAVGASGATYVAWQWRASNATAVTNTAGSITSTVSANTTAGFSIVTFTTSSSTQTIGHGLGVAPAMYIVKNRSAATNWATYHQSLGATKAVNLNLTNAEATSSVYWNDTAPTSTVFTVSGSLFDPSQNAVAYCWSEVAGFSKFGSYTGNGSTDGTFVYTGFRPKFILTKCSSAAYYWVIEDAARNPSNVVNLELFPNDSLAETNASRSVDFLSNGFKIRHTGTTQNENGQTYIYMALAESPFKFANAR